MGLWPVVHLGHTAVLTDSWWPLKLLQIWFPMMLRHLLSERTVCSTKLIPHSRICWNGMSLRFTSYCTWYRKNALERLTFLLPSTPDTVPSLTLRLLGTGSKCQCHGLGQHPLNQETDRAYQINCWGNTGSNPMIHLLNSLWQNPVDQLQAKFHPWCPWHSSYRFPDSVLRSCLLHHPRSNSRSVFMGVSHRICRRPRDVSRMLKNWH